MKVLSKSGDEVVTIEFGKNEFVSTDDGPLLEEIQIPNSDGWAGKGAEGIALRLMQVFSIYKDVVELNICVGRNWTIKCLVSPGRLVPRVEDELSAEKEKA
jgi:hypothetical protein